jgi:enoyl-CoA hydratase
MSLSSSVTSTRTGPVTVVTLDRREARNAVDGPTATALADAFRAFEADDTAAVAVLHGAGGTFCAGADLKAVATERANHLSPDGDGPMGPTRLRMTKPVIAAIEGHAVAGGLELALWCDLRVVAQDAVFGVFCRRWGVPLIDGGTVRLSRIVGQGRAMDLVLTGRAVDAAEAHQIGLATQVVRPGQALDAAVELATALARFPQACLRSDRSSLLEASALDEHEALANEFRRGMQVVRSGETFDGAARFAAGAGRHGQLEGKP